MYKYNLVVLYLLKLPTFHLTLPIVKMSNNCPTCGAPFADPPRETQHWLVICNQTEPEEPGEVKATEVPVQTSWLWTTEAENSNNAEESEPWFPERIEVPEEREEDSTQPGKAEWSEWPQDYEGSGDFEELAEPEQPKAPVLPAQKARKGRKVA